LALFIGFPGSDYRWLVDRTSKASTALKKQQLQFFLYANTVWPLCDKSLGQWFPNFFEWRLPC